MKEKKTAVITFRTEEWVKNLLEETAKQNMWSVAQTVHVLCSKFVTNPQPEKITVKLENLINIINELKAEGNEKGVTITIGLETNNNETEVIKTLNFEMIECGGLGHISGFSNIPEMTAEEIQSIP